MLNVIQYRCNLNILITWIVSWIGWLLLLLLLMMVVVMVGGDGSGAGSGAMVVSQFFEPRYFLYPCQNPTQHITCNHFSYSVYVFINIMYDIMMLLSLHVVAFLFRMRDYIQRHSILNSRFPTIGRIQFNILWRMKGNSRHDSNIFTTSYNGLN